MNCAHCAGMRCPCTCEKDCGSRPTGIGGPAYCPRAVGYLAYLQSTHLYRDDEIASMRDRGFQ